MFTNFVTYESNWISYLGFQMHAWSFRGGSGTKVKVSWSPEDFFLRLLSLSATEALPFYLLWTFQVIILNALNFLILKFSSCPTLIRSLKCIYNTGSYSDLQSFLLVFFFIAPEYTCLKYLNAKNKEIRNHRRQRFIYLFLFMLLAL